MQSPDFCSASNHVELMRYQLLRNMCEGMRKFSNNVVVQSVDLTRHGDKAISRRNRDAMCKQSNGISICGVDPNLASPPTPSNPNGSPLSYPSNLGPYLLSKWYLWVECDEFPIGKYPATWQDQLGANEPQLQVVKEAIFPRGLPGV